MKEIYKKVFDKEVATNFSLMEENEKVSICGIVFSYHHEQDCCERVYADFGILKYYEGKMPNYVKEISIATVEDMGFLLRLKDDDDRELKILINCYNEQNGYYSNYLDLVIEDNGAVSKYSLREENCIQDRIY